MTPFTLTPRTAPLVLLLTLACGEDPEPALQSEHLRFHGDLDGACPALGRLYEREVSRLESTLGRELLEPVDVLVGDDAVAEHCRSRYDGSPPAGCIVSDTMVATTLFALSHELVHAIRRQHGFRGPPFIEEGLATMLGTGRPNVPLSTWVATSDPDLAPIPFLDHASDEETFADRHVGAHFLQWTDATYGREPFVDFLWSDGVREATSASIQAGFAAATGETMLAAQTRWSHQAEHDALFSDLCWDTDAATLPAEGLVVQSAACCSDPSVEQSEPPLVRVGRRCFTVPATTELTAELRAAEGQLILRSDGCDGRVITVEPGETLTFTAVPCRWQALVLSPERCDDASGVRYAIVPL
jgi:hypothetical protein